MFRGIGVAAVLLALIGAATAQERKEESQGPFVITNFTGLFNAKNPWTMKPYEATQSVNVDYAAYGDLVISKRRGCDSVSCFTGIDSVVELYTDYDRPRNRRMVAVVAPTGKAWGEVYITKPGKDKLTRDTANTTKLFDHWPITKATSFARYNNDLYFANGSSKGLAWDGKRVRAYPLHAPGEPSIIPLTSPGGLKGTYYYAFVYARFSGNPDPFGNGINWSTTGYICGPIVAQNQAVLIKDFSWVQADSVSIAEGTTDSLYIGVVRSRGDINTIDQNDSMWFVPGIIHATTPAALYADSIIDTISDAYMTAHYASRKAYEPAWIGRDANGAVKSRYGSPLFDSAKAGLDTNSVYFGYPWSTGMAYAYSKFDTLRGIESELSEPLVIRENVPEKAYGFSFPPLSPMDSGCIYNVYRANLLIVSSDTDNIHVADQYKVPEIVWYYQYDANGNKIYDTIYHLVNVPPGSKPNNCQIGIYTCQFVKQVFDQRVGIDSVLLGRYWQIGAVKPSHTNGGSFFDFANADSIINKIGRPYRLNAIPPIVEKFFVYGQTLYALYQNRLYSSVTGDPSRFNGFDISPIGEFDGDVAVDAWATQDAVRIGKANSIWNVPGGDGKPEIGSYTGMIAARSHVQTPYGDYYLSRRGLEHEVGGQNLEGRYVQDLVSAPINNLQKLSLTQRRSARVAAIPNKELVLTCIGDSSYALNERLGVWSVWTLKFGPWCLYDTSTFSSTARGEVFYFVPPRDSVLYRWAGGAYLGTEWDPHNEPFDMVWESGPLFVDDWNWQVDAARVWGRNCLDGDQLYIGFKDVNGLVLGRNMGGNANDSVMIFENLSAGWELKEKMFKPSPYVKMVLRTFNQNLNQGAFDRIDLWASRKERVR